jgi:PAS domain S-box-containing protein
VSHLEKAMYEAMFGALPDAAMLTDGAGNIRLVNPAFISLFQYRPTR